MATQQRGQMIPKGENKWLLRVYVGRDEAGRRKYHSQAFRGTTAQARQELTRLQAGADMGTVVAKTGRTVAKLIEDYLAGKQKISERTKDQYRWNLERYVVPKVGFLKIEKVTRPTVQQLVNGWIEQGLSPRTIQYVYVNLKAAFQYAVDSGFLLRNPCAGVERPNLTSKDDHEELQTLSKAQTVALLDHAESLDGGDQWYALWAVLLLGGLRPQEACALKWADLSFETLDGDQYVFARVTRAVEWHKGSSRLKETKTKQSRRTVPMDSRVAKALQRHRAIQARIIMQEGPKYMRNDLVFANAVGNVLDISCVRKRWQTVLKGAKLPSVRLYDARHTQATLMLEAGVHPKVVQERLGHHSITLTMDTYSHVVETMQVDAVAGLKAALGTVKAPAVNQ